MTERAMIQKSLVETNRPVTSPLGDQPAKSSRPITRPGRDECGGGGSGIQDSKQRMQANAPAVVERSPAVMMASRDKHKGGHDTVRGRTIYDNSDHKCSYDDAVGADQQASSIVPSDTKSIGGRDCRTQREVHASVLSEPPTVEATSEATCLRCPATRQTTEANTGFFEAGDDHRPRNGFVLDGAAQTAACGRVSGCELMLERLGGDLAHQVNALEAEESKLNSRPDCKGLRKQVTQRGGRAYSSWVRSK